MCVSKPKIGCSIGGGIVAWMTNFGWFRQEIGRDVSLQAIGVAYLVKTQSHISAVQPRVVNALTDIAVMSGSCSTFQCTQVTAVVDPSKQGI